MSLNVHTAADFTACQGTFMSRLRIGRGGRLHLDRMRRVGNHAAKSSSVHTERMQDSWQFDSDFVETPDADPDADRVIVDDFHPSCVSYLTISAS